MPTLQKDTNAKKDFNEVSISRSKSYEMAMGRKKDFQLDIVLLPQYFKRQKPSETTGSVSGLNIILEKRGKSSEKNVVFI